MAMFKCNRCKQVYEDYYPPDDTCMKCKKGTIRIVYSGMKRLSTVAVDNIAQSVDNCQNCNALLGVFTFCIAIMHIV